MFVALGWREGHQRVRDAGQHSLHPNVKLRFEAGEITVENVAVGRVDDRREAKSPRRRATQCAGFGGMRVQHIGTLGVEQNAYLLRRPKIPNRIWITHQVAEHDELHAKLFVPSPRSCLPLRSGPAARITW